MPTNVVMPQMGESVAEGTIVRWLKKVGDHVDRDEPLFEISTDKVDAEIPSPVEGVLAEIRAKEGETVAVESVVAVIAAAGEAVTAPAPPSAPTAAPAPPAPRPAPPAPLSPAPPVAAAPPAASSQANGTGDPSDPRTLGPSDLQSAPPSPSPFDSAQGAPSDSRGADLQSVSPPPLRTSPLVRRIAREHAVDLSAVPGTGLSGRVTKHDILGYLEGRDTAGAPQGPAPAAGPAGASASGLTPDAALRGNVEAVPMSVMRKRIAEHMIMSRRTSAHVHSVFEVDFTRVAQIRQARKEEYERLGVKLTFMPFIVKAAVDALRAVPIVNASIDGETILYKRDINIGVAVALDWGLIVPVILHADEKNLLGIGRALVDLAGRARAKQLKPEEVQGGTFTITNPGVFGALFGMPIISQPQVAILGVGAVEKRPVIVDDAIAIRQRAYMTLGYDHRLIDGAVADQFMSMLKKQIEDFDPTAA
jgi:2-oxoglutarate dehydrogenase E2 component (dihydrolipoamide succinyltransferase)